MNAILFILGATITTLGGFYAIGIMPMINPVSFVWVIVIVMLGVTPGSVIIGLAIDIDKQSEVR